MKHRIAVGLMLFATLATAAPKIDPFTATYAVSYRGLRAGSIAFELRRRADGQYIYESTVQPSFLARMVVSSHATETSRFLMTDKGVQPLAWRLEDGSSSTRKDGVLTFDSANRRVQGVIEEQRIDLPFEPGLQDRMSIQIEVMRALVQGREPGTIALIDDGRVKHYTYTRGGTEQIRTPLGEFSAVLYESTRTGSNRVSRFWYAPPLGYIPVRAEQVRKGKVETVMELAQLQGR